MKFITDNKENYPVKTMCRLLEVSPQGWRKHQQAPQRPGSRAAQNRYLLDQIKRIHRQSRCNYGSPRITMQLEREGMRFGRHRVARLMRKEGIQGRRQRRFRVRTTQSDHDCPIAPNLAAELEVSGPNQLWHADITYIETETGWTYLAAVLDNYTRKIVGWSVGDTLRTELALSALEMALKSQKPKPGLLHHSDRGIQYASNRYRQRLEKAGARASMSRKGNCYDNATMESFFGTLKREQINGTIYPDIRAARIDVFSYIEAFYNTSRIHTSLGGLTPNEMMELAKAC